MKKISKSFWSVLAPTLFGLCLLTPSRSQDLPPRLISIMKSVDCTKCMPRGRSCDFANYTPKFKSRLSVALVKRPKFNGYALDHACGESLLHEACTVYSNIVLYSFPNAEFVVNYSQILPNEKLSAAYEVDANDPHKWSGIRLKEDASYLIASIGGTGLFDKHRSITLACEISD